MNFFYHQADTKKQLSRLNLGKDLEGPEGHGISFRGIWHSSGSFCFPPVPKLLRSCDSKPLHLVYPGYLSQINDPQVFNKSFAKVRCVGLGP